VRDAWEYFVRYEGDRPAWSPDIRNRGVVHLFPGKTADGHVFGWYSWLPSVVWNPGLGLYIMVTGGTVSGQDMADTDENYFDSWTHLVTGSLCFLWSEKPYGPWREFFYTDHWTVDDPANLCYQPKLSPKWISDDGREMIFIWSDAMKDKDGKSHTVNYRWNQMSISLRVQPAR
jgi:hypothetical protein